MFSRARARFPRTSRPPVLSRSTPVQEPELPLFPDRLATAPVSVVAAHARLQGDLVSKGPIQLDGWVRGDVECPSLVIGQRGGVEGRVAADRLVVFGTIIGSVAAWTVILKATSKVIADILHDRLTVVEGAAFEGQCRRGNVRPGPHKTFPDAKRLALLAPGSR